MAQRGQRVGSVSDDAARFGCSQTCQAYAMEHDAPQPMTFSISTESIVMAIRQADQPVVDFLEPVTLVKGNSRQGGQQREPSEPLGFRSRLTCLQNPGAETTPCPVSPREHRTNVGRLSHRVQQAAVFRCLV